MNYSKEYLAAKISFYSMCKEIKASQTPYIQYSWKEFVRHGRDPQLYNICWPPYKDDGAYEIAHRNYNRLIFPFILDCHEKQVPMQDVLTEFNSSRSTDTVMNLYKADGMLTQSERDIASVYSGDYAKLMYKAELKANAQDGDVHHDTEYMGFLTNQDGEEQETWGAICE